MANLPPALDALLNAFNERDLDKIRGHIEPYLEPDVVFCDPNYLVRGVAEFVQMVKEFRLRIPNALCEHSSGVDTHHGRYRYHWTVSVDGQVLVPGFDVTLISEAGRIVRIDGFFGPVPAH